MSLRKLSKRPLRNAAELAELEERFARSVRRWRRFARVLAGGGLFLVLLNVLTAASEPEGPLVGDVWSLVVIACAGAFWTPFFLRAIWGRRRLVQAQLRLLRQRGLAGDGASDVAELAEAIELLLPRIEATVAPRPELVSLLAETAARVRALCRRLEADEAAQEDGSERVVLEALRFELASFEIDAFARSGFLRGDEAFAALQRAAALLDPVSNHDGPASGLSAGGSPASPSAGGPASSASSSSSA